MGKTIDGAAVLDEEEVREEKPEIDQSILDQRLEQQVSSKIVFDKKVDFTKDLARVFIQMPEFQGERPLRDSHVEVLIQHARKGTFLIEQASLIDCLCKYDGVVRRLNGHHTCWMRHYMPDSWIFKIRYLRYEVENEDDFRVLYSLIDRNAPRSNGHVAQARLFGTSQYMGISKKTIEATKSGLAYWLWGDNPTERKRHKIDEIVSMMESGSQFPLCHDIALFINNFGKNDSFLRRASVIAAMFATFNKTKTEGHRFWTEVREGLNFEDKADPRKTLRDYLHRYKVAGGNAYNKANIVSAETMYRGSIYAWNAWRRGEKLSIIKDVQAPNRPSIK